MLYSHRKHDSWPGSVLGCRRKLQNYQNNELGAEHIIQRAIAGMSEELRAAAGHVEHTSVATDANSGTGEHSEFSGDERGRGTVDEEREAAQGMGASGDGHGDDRYGGLSEQQARNEFIAYPGR